MSMSSSLLVSFSFSLSLLGMYTYGPLAMKHVGEDEANREVWLPLAMLACPFLLLLLSSSLSLDEEVESSLFHVAT